MRNLFRSALLLIFLTFSKAHAQIDVQHCQYQLTLSDASDSLIGTAGITVKFLEKANRFSLDLATLKEGRGMQVYRVASGDTTFSITHVHDTLFIKLPYTMEKDSVQTFWITYAGIPANGLIISKNKWGERTFFADNWPNRAHQWLPCNDRPDDKATVEFTVIAPERYKVISNGTLLEEKGLDSNRKVTHWKEETPIPTKVMVIGAARFAIKNLNDSTVTPVSAWVYPQDSTKGFYDYALAPDIVKFFSDYIGPYPFEKLANVQSKTIFGGMENASCIFYAENTVTGTRKSEALLAHEIAHQWFGNSATEKSFAHVWLSEGFATYMTHLFLEKKYGRDTLLKRMQADLYEVLAFTYSGTKPVVDSTSAWMDLLNANSYQKGGWVLHMLRRQVGDALFQQILQTYYRSFRCGNADTQDFQKVVEEISGKQLGPYFNQWLYRPGFPKIDVQWKWSRGKVQLTVQQTGEVSFQFPLEIGFADAQGVQTGHKIFVNKTKERFDLPATQKPTVVLLDPAVNLLFEGTIRE
jgi:aminopeptidase N